jgi:hypothetical protein
VRKDRDAHTVAFLQGTGAQFAYAPDIPFDFLQAARVHNPIALDLAEHLSNFLEHIALSTQLTEFAAPLLASTLLLDNYPTDAHGTYPFFSCSACVLTLEQ